MVKRLISDERGVALVLAIVTMVVLSSLTASVLLSVAVNDGSAHQSGESTTAFGLAEDGLAYAEGRLYSAATSSETPLVPLTTFTENGGTVTYQGTLVGSTWTLTGKGVYNGVTRTVSAQSVVPQAQVQVDTTIWSYFYINGTGSCTALSGNMSLNIPLYTNGSICMSGNAHFTGSDLEIGGNLTLTGNSKIGVSAAQPISKMNVVGSCSPAPCDGSHSPIWVNAPGVGHIVTPVVTKPPIDLPGNYASAAPGPLSPCQAGSGVPTPFFDNDTTLNNSLGNVNLFPSGVAYDCKSGANELKWDGSSKLTVNGAFYFDGSLSMSGNLGVTYTGKGTIYFTGSINMSGNSYLCGIANCTTSWNPNTNVLVLVAGCWANSTGSSKTASCVNLSGNNNLQAGTYVTTGYFQSGNATNMGPVITDSATLSGNSGVLLPIHNLPPGAPANTSTVSLPPSPVKNWSG